MSNKNHKRVSIGHSLGGGLYCVEELLVADPIQLLNVRVEGKLGHKGNAAGLHGMIEAGSSGREERAVIERDLLITTVEAGPWLVVLLGLPVVVSSLFASVAEKVGLLLPIEAERSITVEQFVNLIDPLSLEHPVHNWHVVLQTGKPLFYFLLSFVDLQYLFSREDDFWLALYFLLVSHEALLVGILQRLECALQVLELEEFYVALEGGNNQEVLEHFVLLLDALYLLPGQAQPHLPRGKVQGVDLDLQLAFYFILLLHKDAVVYLYFCALFAAGVGLHLFDEPVDVLEEVVVVLEVDLNFGPPLLPEPVLLLERHLLLCGLGLPDGVRNVHGVEDLLFAVFFGVEFVQEVVFEVDELVVEGDDYFFGGLEGYFLDEGEQFLVPVEVVHGAEVAVLVELDHGEENIGLLLAVVPLEPELVPDFLHLEDDVLELLVEKDLQVQQLLEHGVGRLLFMEILADLDCNAPEELVLLAAGVAVVVEVGGQLRKYHVDLLECVLELSDALAGVLLPLLVLLGAVLDVGGGLYHLALEVVAEVGHVVLFIGNNAHVVLLALDGAPPQGVEYLNRCVFGVFDEEDQLLEHGVLVLDELLAVGGEVGLEELYLLVGLLPLGQDFAHQLPALVHLLPQLLLLPLNQLGPVVEVGFYDVFLKLLVLPLHLRVAFNQNGLLALNRFVQLFVLPYLLENLESHVQLRDIAFL